MDYFKDQRLHAGRLVTDNGTGKFDNILEIPLRIAQYLWQISHFRNYRISMTIVCEVSSGNLMDSPLFSAQICRIGYKRLR